MSWMENMAMNMVSMNPKIQTITFNGMGLNTAVKTKMVIAPFKKSIPA